MVKDRVAVVGLCWRKEGGTKMLGKVQLLGIVLAGKKGRGRD